MQNIKKINSMLEFKKNCTTPKFTCIYCNLTKDHITMEFTGKQYVQINRALCHILFSYNIGNTDLTHSVKMEDVVQEHTPGNGLILHCNPNNNLPKRFVGILP